jgi:hypothetical protein
MLRLALLGSVVLAAHAPAAEPVKVLAAGDWSAPVADSRGYALRGRLVLGEKPAAEGRRETVVYVELQDASPFIGSPMRLYCEMARHDFRPEYKGGLDCELKDADKRPVPPSSYPFGGATPRTEWVTLPTDGTIRLRASPFGVRRAKAKAITPHLGKLWVIADDDPKVYFLSGTFTINPPADALPASDTHVWRGTIPLPAVRITGANVKATDGTP